MPITFRVASAPQEIDDALRLRHQVFVEEEGRYSDKAFPDGRIVDRFDIIPMVAHVIAYDDEEPVAGIRLNCDLGLGLPSEAHYDFQPYRRQLLDESRVKGVPPPILTSGGLLAIRRQWRRRRDVVLALFRFSAGVLYSWEATHIVATVSRATLTLYGRMGFAPIADSVWNPLIGDHIIPIATPTPPFFRWAFGGRLAPSEPVWQERRRVRCGRCHSPMVEEPSTPRAISRPPAGNGINSSPSRDNRR